MLTYSVKSLTAKSVGSSETHRVNETISFDEAEHLFPLSPLTGTLRFIKLPHEINVRMEDFEIDIEATCSRCLKKFPQPIVIPLADREFLIDLPQSELTPGEDFFSVDKKTWEIALLEMVRQEILLHFPSIPVCSKSCKGLCNECGKNLNERECGCIREIEIPKEKPLKDLKKFFS